MEDKKTEDVKDTKDVEVTENSITPEESYRIRLNYSIKQYRTAVRWLRDARVYKSSYRGDLTFEGKSWKDDIEGELAFDSNVAYREAASSVLYWRKRINHYNYRLMQLSSKKKKEREQDGRKDS